MGYFGHVFEFAISPITPRRCANLVDFRLPLAEPSGDSNSCYVDLRSLSW